MQRRRQSHQDSIILDARLGIPRRASPKNGIGDAGQRLVQGVL